MEPGCLLRLPEIPKCKGCVQQYVNDSDYFNEKLWVIIPAEKKKQLHFYQYFASPKKLKEQLLNVG